MLLTDDLDPELEATETIAFSLDGATYEIDLNDEHSSQMRDASARSWPQPGRSADGLPLDEASSPRPTRPAPRRGTVRTPALCGLGLGSTTSR